MKFGYIVLLTLGPIIIVGGLLLLWEAKKYRKREDAALAKRERLNRKNRLDRKVR